MDWNKIKEKHPKAWNKLISWQEGKFGFICRQLYDFFDEQGIIIIIEYGLPSATEEYGFIPSIRAEWPPLESYKTRTEAEEKAFEKAFEILNNKLD